MTQLRSNLNEKIFTLNEYLNCEFILEKPYELEAGRIVEMPPESPENVRIALFLLMGLIEKLGVDRGSHKAEIIISGSRVNSRIPDVTVFSESGAKEIIESKPSTITLDMFPPILVIEIVSPGKVNRDRDYRYKRSEYAARGIPHYWIIDPQDQKFVCLELVDGLYESETYNGDRQTISFIDPFDFEVNLSQLFV